MITLTALQFTYPGKSKPTLQIPSLTIQAGEKVFLFGPSGTGKTTLLEVLAGVLVPQSGQVKINGVDLVTMNSRQRDQFRSLNLGYIFQSFNLIPYLSVQENILLPLSLRQNGLKNESALLKEMDSLIQRLGLESHINDKVMELSVGQQQRVAVARALLAKPQVILADEPTSALDQDHRERFLKVLFDLCKEQGTTLVFVSHDRTIQHLFDRSISLSEINQASFGGAEYL